MINGRSDYERTAEDVVREIPAIVLEACMRVGVVRGEHGEFLNGFFRPDFDCISYQYSLSYGCLDVLFEYQRKNTSEQWHIWNRRLIYRDDSINAAEVTAAFNQFARLLMPQAKQKNDWCACENPYHQRGKYGGEFDMCYPVGDKWLCQNCINQFSLAASNPEVKKGTKQERSERDKMTPALRFKVLERDGFTCKSCGRNAREDGVKLHVDHVLAIKNGGKTELGNLHTLCQDCNLGKSAKRVEQMEIWK